MGGCARATYRRIDVLKVGRKRRRRTADDCALRWSAVLGGCCGHEEEERDLSLVVPVGVW